MVSSTNRIGQREDALEKNGQINCQWRADFQPMFGSQTLHPHPDQYSFFEKRNLFLRYPYLDGCEQKGRALDKKL